MAAVGSSRHGVAAKREVAVSAMGFIRRFGILIVIAVAVVGFFLLRSYLPNDAGALQVGDCFDLPSEQSDVKDVQNHPCTESHGAEVVAVVSHPAAKEVTYPGASGFTTFAGEQCIPAFKTYTGLEIAAVAELDMGLSYPTSAGWTGGDRKVICYLYRVDEQKFTGSKKAISQ